MSVDRIETAQTPVAAGTVLRGVVVAREPRTLARPRSGAAAPQAMPHAPGRSDAAAAEPVTERAAHEFAQLLVAAAAQSAQARPAREPEPVIAVQPPVRDATATHEEARRTGHAEGLAAGQAEGLAAGRKQGLEEGLEQGRKMARTEAERAQSEAREETADRIAQLAVLLSSAREQVAQRVAAAQEDVLAVCFQAVTRIVGAQALTAEGVRGIVEQAIAQVGEEESLALHLHPRDLALLQEDPAFEERFGKPGLQCVADERLTAGGCLVSSAHGTLDARLDTQLARLAELFAHARRPGDPA